MPDFDSRFDVIIVGAGTAGMPAAIKAADRGAKVMLLEASKAIGGTLRWSNGELSGAGTQRQRERGISDVPDAHFDDVMRLSKGIANPAIVRLAVDNAAATIDWLYGEGFSMDPSVPQVIHSHQAYSAARTYWGTNQARSVIEVLEPLVEKHRQSGAITLKFETTFEDVIVDAGAVVGVMAMDKAGTVKHYGARQVALTSGGCMGNPALFEALHGFPQYLKAWCTTNTGAGISAAQRLGATVSGQEAYTPAFNAVLEGAAPASPLVCRLNTIPEWRQPWEIYVNSAGERFVREDGDSIDDRERSLFHQPGMTAWMVFDQAIMDAAPPRYRKWYGAYETPPRDPFDGSLWAFSKADTITALAARAGIDPDGLAQTIHAFNAGEDGEPDALGRRHRPLPIAQPPFYAIRFQGCSVFSAAGLSVNDRLEVLGPGGAPLPNLYAAGEILGSWQTMGQGNSGGMMATPALTFGRLLGERIMRW